MRGDEVDVGREAFTRRAWAQAADVLSRARDARPLDAEDLERLAVALHMIGRDDASDEAWVRAHHGHLAAGSAERAALCAFWLGLLLMLRGETARAQGWLARAARIIEEESLDCVAEGFLLVPEGVMALGSGDTDRAAALATDAIERGRRFDDADLLALGRLGLAEAAIAAGDASRGISLLDEVMVAITAGEVTPIPAGIIYCAVIEACVAVFDLRRAGEWTDALHRWCDDQPDLVPYRGQCLVHRSQVLQAHGDWSAAVSEATQACERLTEPPHPALGEAQYQRGELHRLHGEHDLAEEAYRTAGAFGREPAPGLALLRLAQGRTGDAVAAMRRMLAEGGGEARPELLAAAVEILLTTGGVKDARTACDELTATAERIGMPLVLAMAAHARGSVLVETGQAAQALVELRQAISHWRELAMPYQEARTRVVIARADLALDDRDSAGFELDRARQVFESLGAGPDLAAIAPLTSRDPARDPVSRLTDREQEVLRLVAAGCTNREVASRLVISEHTVARHVQNIFAKLGVTSRSAATAWAYEHDLV